MKAIDLNCDMGESFGRYVLGTDEVLMDYVSSINLACGFHAGDPLVMQRTVEMAVKKKVAIGAHPAYPDLQGFGRRFIEMSAEEVEAMVLYQLGALWGFVKVAGAELIHVKPHGALYNRAAQDIKTARAIASAVRRFSKMLILVGLANSALVQVGQEIGLKTANEGFVERGYQEDGSLIPRGQKGDLIHDPRVAAQQAVRLATEGIAMQVSGHSVEVKVDTLCIHGDSPQAVSIVKAVRSALEEAGLEIRGMYR